MKKVNWGVVATVAAAFAVLTVFIVHISQELRELNEMVTAMKDDFCDTAN